MLTVRPINDPPKDIAVFRSFGIELNDGEMAYYAAEVDESDLDSKDRLLGLCVFSLKNGRNEIVYLNSAEGTDDEESLFIMGRAVMSFMYRCGVKTARISSNVSDKIADSLGFDIGSDERSIDLEDFFDSPCRHNSNNGKE